MKKIKRIMVFALAAMLIAACAITMTACGKEVTLTATYASTPNLGYTNMRPANNYYMTTFSCQTLETYSDNTYCLIQTSIMFSGLVLPEDSQNIQAGSGRTTSVKRYYGTFTSKISDIDEDVLEIVLSKPTRYVVSGNGMDIYFDTANWTDAMKTKASTATESTGYTIPAETENGTSEEYLAKYAFEEQTIEVTVTIFKFEYVKLM